MAIHQAGVLCNFDSVAGSGDPPDRRRGETSRHLEQGPDGGEHGAAQPRAAPREHVSRVTGGTSGERGGPG